MKRGSKLRAEAPLQAKDTAGQQAVSSRSTEAGRLARHGGSRAQHGTAGMPQHTALLNTLLCVAGKPASRSSPPRLLPAQPAPPPSSLVAAVLANLVAKPHQAAGVQPAPRTVAHCPRQAAQPEW